MPATNSPRPLIPSPVRLGSGRAKLRAEVRDFVRAELEAGSFVPRVDCWQGGWDEAFSRKLGARGWLGSVVPREYGGQARSSVDRYVINEELLAAGAPIAAHWVADRQIAPSLLRYGNDYLKRRYLPAISRGESYWAIGLSEPDAGSDLAAVRTAAKRVEGGWRLTGTKVWTSGAHRAHAFFVLARTSPSEGRDRHAGLSQLTVELTQPGVTVRPILWINGEHHFNEVVLEDVFVRDEMVLGEVGDGWRQATSELAHERSGPERFLSTTSLLLAMIARLAASTPASDAWEQHTIGALTTRLWAIRQMSLAIAAALDRGELPDVAAALVKDLGTRLEGAIIDASRLLLRAGPEYDDMRSTIADAVVHAPGFTLRGGTNEILRGVVARALELR